MTIFTFVGCMIAMAAFGFALGWMDGWRAGLRRERMEVPPHGAFHVHDGPSRHFHVATPDLAIAALFDSLTPITPQIDVKRIGSLGEWQ